jgi:HEAT repeat protein
VEALFRERDQELYGRLVQSLEGIAQESLLEHRPLLAGRISDVLAEQLRLLSTRPQAQILIRALANIGDAKAILGLASALHVRVLSPQISTTLTRLGSKAVSPLLHLLEISEDRSVRLELLPVLARIGSTAVDPLLRALSDERWYVRRNASLLLGYTRDVNAVLPLRECLRDSDPRIRLEAVRALVEIQGEDAEPAVVPLLKDPDRSVRLEAIALMAKIGRDRSVWTLLGILRKRINPFAGRNDEERTAACQALSSIGDRRAEPALRRLLRDRSYVVRNAARSALTALQEKASQIERPT